ncbi:hypothetical protein OH76DRAFT_1422578 [Lentinus brumalis]|uniref:Uncharacterized protein n=1 Tax=Lentinus brumalis TaxID=2498619 RepID=A0A371CPT0_9APHY|nr:hypothetical protein OH76DRAFT_1422578 [Polyporus brumalis]
MSNNCQELDCLLLRPWTVELALERYAKLAERFDVARFIQRAPDFEEIPWPTLVSPDVLQIEGVRWDAVEAFFAAARSKMSAAAYGKLVKGTMIRFHPDKWAARNILLRARDEDHKKALTRAALRVAQEAGAAYERLTRN